MQYFTMDFVTVYILCKLVLQLLYLDVYVYLTIFMYDIGIWIVVLVREFTKLYGTVKDQERVDRFMEVDSEINEVDKNLVILQQRKIIEQLKNANTYYKMTAKLYKKLYLWQENKIK